MFEVQPLDGVAGVAKSGFLAGTCKGSLPMCAAGVAEVEEGRVAIGGVEGVQLEEGAFIFGVEEALKVLRVAIVVPTIPFLQA